jgi:hypothetical protein
MPSIAEISDSVTDGPLDQIASDAVDVLLAYGTMKQHGQNTVLRYLNPHLRIELIEYSSDHSRAVAVHEFDTLVAYTSEYPQEAKKTPLQHYRPGAWEHALEELASHARKQLGDD